MAMPELPEVEAWVRELDPLVSRAPVAKVTTTPPALPSCPSDTPTRAAHGLSPGDEVAFRSSCTSARSDGSALTLMGTVLTGSVRELEVGISDCSIGVKRRKKVTGSGARRPRLSGFTIVGRVIV